MTIYQFTVHEYTRVDCDQYGRVLIIRFRVGDNGARIGDPERSVIEPTSFTIDTLRRNRRRPQFLGLFYSSFPYHFEIPSEQHNPGDNNEADGEADGAEDNQENQEHLHQSNQQDHQVDYQHQQDDQDEDPQHHENSGSEGQKEPDDHVMDLTDSDMSDEILPPGFFSCAQGLQAAEQIPTVSASTTISVNAPADSQVHPQEETTPVVQE